ncbi:probable G-protein coupled receptor frpr-1 [Littorina saxatilis]|uniref:probable G-protein coupled receptor frpr-1 n=1 Tax=Littorina saxatilis TaxID=31220 RepID=UPI0038B668E1
MLTMETFIIFTSPWGAISLSDETTSSSPTIFQTETQTTNSTLNGGGIEDGDQQSEFLPWDNPDNVLSLDTQFTITQIMSLFIVTTSTLGVVLNLLNCVVYAKLGLRDRINLLLFSLAVADGAVSVCMLLYTLEVCSSLFLDGGIQPHCPILSAVTNNGGATLYSFTYVSGFVSTLIACERCLCITFPFKAKRLLRTSTAGVVVLFATVVLFSLHYFISEKYKLRCEYVPSIRASVPVYFASQFYRDHSTFVDILNVIVFGSTLPFSFVIATTITTVVTAVKLRRAATWRQSTATVTMGTKDVALTKMLVAVSCLFVVCNLPNIMIRTTPLFMSEFRIGGKKQNLLLLCVSVLYCFNTLNSSLNFFFYYTMGSKFRATLRGMFCHREQKLDVVLGFKAPVTQRCVLTTTMLITPI